MTRVHSPASEKGVYRKPQIKDGNTVERMTQNSSGGWPPEGEGEQILWGNFAPEFPDTIGGESE